MGGTSSCKNQFWFNKHCLFHIAPLYHLETTETEQVQPVQLSSNTSINTTLAGMSRNVPIFGNFLLQKNILHQFDSFWEQKQSKIVLFWTKKMSTFDLVHFLGPNRSNIADFLPRKLSLHLPRISFG